MSMDIAKHILQVIVEGSFQLRICDHFYSKNLMPLAKP
jgi:hypothetical protein